MTPHAGEQFVGEVYGVTIRRYESTESYLAALEALKPLGRMRSELAAAGAEAVALAGWQALDLGRPRASWRLHAEACSLAYESGDLSVIAHVTAQQDCTSTSVIPRQPGRVEDQWWASMRRWSSR
ncbi:MAG: hypothetical protein ACRCZD_11250 [Phycicoccus sp.]